MKIIPAKAAFSKADEYAKHGYRPRLKLKSVSAEGALMGTPAELDFARKALEKRGRALRNGWPDFLLELPDKTIGVEVKYRGDRISAAQERMFEALEKVGLLVYVWSPASADRLIPWRKFKPGERRMEKRRRKARRIPISAIKT